MAVTIRDLARELNLSITTVSRAIDGYGDVAEGTRARILRAAQERGYTPNRAARQLRTQRADSLGYILPGSPQQFTDPFFSEFVAGLGDALAGSGFDLLVSSAPHGEAAERELYARWINAHKVDGFVLNRLRLRDWRVQFLSERHFPFVTLERTQDPYEYLCVTVNGKSGVRRVVRALAESGRRRIAYIGGLPELVIHNERYQGYLLGMADALLSPDERLVLQADLTREGGYRATLELLGRPEPPDAVVCVNDLTAIGVLRAARERGIPVGKALAVTGFDGIEEAAHSLPPLTTLSQPVYAVSQSMVRLLMPLITGETVEQSCLSIEPELILRESTAPLSV